MKRNSSTDISNVNKKNKITSDNNSHLECPICFTLLECPIVLPSCGHTFCKSCLLEWKAEKKTVRGDDDDNSKNCESCPVCRISFKHDNILDLSVSVILLKMIDDVLDRNYMIKEDFMEDIELRCYKAAHSNENNRLRFLMDKYQDVKFEYKKKDLTCFYWLCHHNCDDLDLLQSVLDKIDPYDIALTEYAYNFYSPLSWVCAHGFEEKIICDMLNLMKSVALEKANHSLETEIEIDDETKTPLQWLIHYEYKEAALLLVELGAVVDYLDEDEESSLKDLCYDSILSRFYKNNYIY